MKLQLKRLFRGKREKRNEFDDALRRFFATTEIDLLIDVGANKGQFAKSMRALGYQQQILSIEPSSRAFAVLQQETERDDRWNCHHGAVGSESTEMEINLSQTDDLFTSLLTPKSSTLEVHPYAATSRRERVQVRPLPEIIDEFGGCAGQRLFLKTDTQGFDFRVLSACTSILPQCECVTCEMSVYPLYEDQDSHWKIINLMQEHQFEPFAFRSIVRESNGWRLVEYDCAFAKRATSDPA